MKLKWLIVSGLVAAAFLVMFAAIPDAKAVDCSGIFGGNATVTACDATPALNSFASTYDAWGVYQRATHPNYYPLLDDSTTYPTDALGVIQSGKTDPFFGICDLENANNVTGTGLLEIDFDISGLGNLTSLQIDIGAMGDFEAQDVYTFAYQIDGGVVTSLFSVTANEADAITYTMEAGTEVFLADPLVLSPTGSCPNDTLDNNLQTCTASVNGSGNTLTLIFGAANNADEVFVFDNIVINGSNGSVNAVILNSIDTNSIALPLLASLMFVVGLVVLRKRR